MDSSNGIVRSNGFHLLSRTLDANRLTDIRQSSSHLYLHVSDSFFFLAPLTFGTV